MQISKWGNSLAVRLPAALVDALGLKEGDEIELHTLAEAAFGVDRPLTLEERFQIMRRFSGRLPDNYKFDRDEAHER